MARHPRSLFGRVVAITGGARGIGRATAEALVDEGARVAIGDLDEALARRTAEELGAGTVALPLDVTDRGSFTTFLEQVERELGPLDVLVNNAGIMPVGPFVEEDDASARRQIDINVHGVLLGMKLALPGMLERNRGHIVNLASGAGKAGFPGIATYCATKFAVVGASEAVRAELDGTPIELSVVMPALVQTELIDGLDQDSVPIKPATPQDVADAIVDALKFQRFDVFVPRSAGRLHKVMQNLPRPARERMAKQMKLDKLMTDFDATKRAGYEQRAAQSEPGVGSGTAETGAPAERDATAEPVGPRA